MELIEKIRAEIERLKAKYRKDMYKSNHEGLASVYKIEAYNELLSFLSTLESEKPMEDGLEEEIQGKRKKLIEVFGPMNGEQVLALKDFARHFAEWGAEHLADERKMIEPEKKEGRTDCSPQGEVPDDSLATQSYEKIQKEIDFEQELYKHFGMVKDFTLGMRIAQCFYNLGRESGSSEIPNDQEPEVDLEDELNRWMGSTDCFPEGVRITPLPKAMEIVKKTARHFYELGCRRTAEKYDEMEYNRQRAEEETTRKEFVEELDRYFFGCTSSITMPECYKACEHFAKWGAKNAK